LVTTRQTEKQKRQRGQTDKKTFGSRIEGGSDERWDKDSNWEVIGYSQRNRHKDTLTKRQKDTHTNRRKNNNT